MKIGGDEQTISDCPAYTMGTSPQRLCSSLLTTFNIPAQGLPFYFSTSNNIAYPVHLSIPLIHHFDTHNRSHKQQSNRIV
jgi:hypothetical protein